MWMFMLQVHTTVHPLRAYRSMLTDFREKKCLKKERLQDIETILCSLIEYTGLNLQCCVKHHENIE